MLTVVFIEHSLARLQEVGKRKVVVPVQEDILRAAERHKAGTGEEITQFLAELIHLGFEHRLEQLYRQLQAGEISLGYFAGALGLSVRDLYAGLEQRGLSTSNIGARPSAIG